MTDAARRGPIAAHVAASLTAASVVIWVWTGLVRDGTAGLVPWGIPILLFAITVLAAGWVIAWRRPGTPLGWILVAIAFLLALQGPAEALGYALLPTSRVAGEWLLAYGGSGSQWSWLPPIALLFTQVPLRFPDGRLPSRGWRWFSWFSIAALVLASAQLATTGRSVATGVPNPAYVDWGHASDALNLAGLALCAIAFLGSIPALFVRYRRADAVTRAQLRWVYWALAVVIGALVGSWAIFQGVDAQSGLLGAIALGWEFATGLGYSLIPVAILVAVLRHGLYEIDRIISRTAAYAIVTLAVIAVYVGIALLAGLVLPGLPAVGVAVATLSAAAVFFPVLRRVRTVVDRRFNRAQYDAERVAAGFGQRVRDGVDPQAVPEDLQEAIDRALEPIGLGLWLSGSAP